MRLRQLSGQDVVKALAKVGFQVVSIRGCHAKLRRLVITGERQTLTIPLHKQLRPGTLHAVFRRLVVISPKLI